MPLQGDSRNPLAYLIYDLMTGNMLAELPFTGVKFSQRLNTPGTFSAALDFLNPTVKALIPGELIQPGRTAVFIDYMGTLLWGGIIWTVNFSRANAGAVPIQGKEFWSYFASRVQAKDYTNPTWSTATVAGVPLCGDAMAIADQIVSDAVGVSNSAFGASTGFPLSINQNNGSPTPEPFWTAQSYPGTQLQSVDTIVSDLTQMGWDVGFDFAIDVAYVNGPTVAGEPTVVPGLTMNMAYPRRGRVADVSSLVLVTSAAHDYSYPQDSTNQAESIYATGSGSGTQASVSNPAPLTAGWPLLEQVNSYTNIASNTQLRNIAREDVNTQCWPVTTPQVTIPLFGDPAPTEYGLGDDIRWVVEPDERFPHGCDAFWRIVGIDCTVVEEGISTAVLTFNQPPGSSIPEPPT